MSRIHFLAPLDSAGHSTGRQSLCVRFWHPGNVTVARGKRYVHIAFPPCYSNISGVPKANAQALPTRGVTGRIEWCQKVNSAHHDPFRTMMLGMPNRPGAPGPICSSKMDQGKQG